MTEEQKRAREALKAYAAARASWVEACAKRSAAEERVLETRKLYEAARTKVDAWCVINEEAYTHLNGEPIAEDALDDGYGKRAFFDPTLLSM